MPSFIFEYRCDQCGHTATSRSRGDSLYEEHYNTLLGLPCPNRILRRLWSFSYHRGFSEHFNVTVNKPISSMRQFKDELSRKGEEYSAYTGLEVNYQPVDATDVKTLNVTSEGLDSTNEQRMKKGLRPISPDG